MTRCDFGSCSQDSKARTSRRRVTRRAFGLPITAARELIEEVLDTWAKHPATGLLIPRSEYEAALKTINGDRTSFTVKIDTEEVQKSIAKAAGDAVEAVKTENLSILERIKNLFKPAAPMPEPEPKIAEQIAKTAASARSKALVERLQAAGRI